MDTAKVNPMVRAVYYLHWNHIPETDDEAWEIIHYVVGKYNKYKTEAMAYLVNCLIHDRPYYG